MSGVAIYMEGGGNGPDSKAALRQGMDVFLVDLKKAARERSWRWQLVCCGSRNQAYQMFNRARQAGDMSIVVLLVDSEGPVNGTARAHLIARDRWALQGVQDDTVHMMIQAMEAWIVADAIALAGYYGQQFKGNALPKAANLEAVAKADVAKALAKATEKTKKGAYHKIRHAGDLLKKITPSAVRKRCPSCKRMFALVSAKIAGGT